MEWGVLGYSGPTVLVIKTTSDAVLGAFAESPWRDTKAFYGSPDCFLFQLSPALRVYRAVDGAHNFMYLHAQIQNCLVTDKQGLPHGVGFGGTLSKPRLFIPESFEHCSASFLDKTFQAGELLPPEALEKFEINCLEIWGVGGDESISKGLRDREAHREEVDKAIHKSRVINDKSTIAKDLKSGIMPAKIFQHIEQVRGRHEFAIDDEHGGYKVEP
jgi:hypothetical protein